MALLDEQLEQARKDFPQTEALLDIYGIGVFSALGSWRDFESAPPV